ncbi:MAG: PadR family transcriptional regulator [Thermoguttaceae bacterium]|jgi:transcriptional regulator
MPDQNEKGEFVQGTLDMLILKTLSVGPLHGYAVASRIQQASDDYLKVEEGSLYPALHRMQRRGWVESEWGLSEAKRKAKYYRLTAAGRAQLKVAVKTWTRVVEAIAGVMGTRFAET